MAKNNNEIAYEKVTNFLVDKVESAQSLVWRRPWLKRSHKNFLTNHEYQGSNIWTLNIVAMISGFQYPLWAGFRQITNAGGSVKGQSGTPILRVFKKKYPVKDSEGNEVWEDGEQKFFQVLRMNYVYVWNIEQTGINPEPYLEEGYDHQEILECESVIENFEKCPPIKYGGNRAFYSPSKDFVGMPNLNSFHSPEEYYSTHYHELVHSTGHKSRLNRDSIMKNKGFGSEIYSFEELIAEFGACYLNNMVGIDSESVMDNSAAYVKGWSKALRENPRWFVSAASEAEKAVKFILGEDI